MAERKGAAHGSVSNHGASEQGSSQATGGFPEGASQWWRTVLGEYPTGVTAITSTDAGGEPLGMVVGTFMAISETPRLIGFLAMEHSSTFRAIRENGTFCASVLGYAHEEACRRIAAKTEDRFSGPDWETSELGNLRRTDAVSWFEARITETRPIGDHILVVAETTGFGTGDGASGLPLLYLKGGYGSFAVPSMKFDIPGFAEQLRTVERARGVLQELADETGTECLLATPVDDSVLVLTGVNLLPSRPARGLVGMNFPFAAPLTPALATWGDPERLKLWEENSRHLIGRVDRPLLAKLRESVREHGYAMTTGTNANVFDEVANDPSASRVQLAEMWNSMKANVEQSMYGARPGDPADSPVSSLQFPVFDVHGTARFELVISGFAVQPADPGFAPLVARIAQSAARLTEMSGGVVPRDYRVG